jgi:uncharacterized membrane protein
MMVEEVGSGYYSETENKYIEAPKKQLFRMQIPYSLRFGLIWTLFFVIIGIVIQSIQQGYFVFGEFFTTNYADWFRSFGTFTDITIYPTGLDVLYAILRHWYYFFVTGGYLSVLWGIISLIIHWEVVFKKVEKQPAPEKPQPRPLPVIPPKVEKKSEPEKSRPEEEIRPFIPARPISQDELYDWLDEGYLFLAEKNLRKAEIIYEQLRRAYDYTQDSGRIMYRRILDFFDEIMMERQPKRKLREDWYG